MAKAQSSQQRESQKTNFLGVPALELLGQLSLLLVKEHLFPLKQQYDDALRSLSKDYPTPALYHDQQKASYTKGRQECREHLSLCLYGEFEAMLTSAIAEMELWPTTSSKPHPADAIGVSAHESKPPQTAVPSAREAEEESLFVSQSPAPRSPRPVSTSGAASGPCAEKTIDDNTRSTTTATLAALNKQWLPAPQPAQREISSSSTHRNINKDMPGPSTGTKRPAVCMEDFFSSTKSSSAKKPRSPGKPESKSPMMVPKPYITKKNITLAEVHEDECVHYFEQHRGLYVLRCNLTTCKKAVASTTSTLQIEDGKKGEFSKFALYFTANPLASNRARDHFKSRGHGLRDMSEIYEKYAIRVIDATEDRNMGSPSDKNPCMALGENYSSKATQVNCPSILRRTFGGAAKDSDAMKRPWDTESYQSSPNPPSREKCPDTYSPPAGGASTSKIDTPSTTSPLSDEASRKRPKRAAASAVTSYGPFPISDDEGGGFSRPQPKLAKARIVPEADKSSRNETTDTANPKPNGKGKATPDLSFNPSGTADSDSDDSDSSIPASLQRMRELQSRII